MRIALEIEFLTLMQSGLFQHAALLNSHIYVYLILIIINIGYEFLTRSRLTKLLKTTVRLDIYCFCFVLMNQKTWFDQIFL